MKALIGIAMTTLLLPGCFLRSDPLFCDDSNPCPADTEHSFCDISGAFGAQEGNTCIAVPDGMCDKNSQCDDEAPICDASANSCRGCVFGSSECDSGVCRADGRCVECLTSAECAAGTEACSIDNTCVPVCENNDSCPDAAPICAPTGECRGCTAHEQCDALVCDKTSGECVDAASVIYVEATGTDAATCGTTPASPCSTIMDPDTGDPDRVGALDLVTATRKWIRISGQILEDVDVSAAGEVNFVGPRTAIMRAATSSPSTVFIRKDAGAAVRIDGITVRTSIGGSGVECLRGNTLVVRDALLANNEYHGILVEECEVTLETSEVRDNKRGGVAIKSASFHISGNLIARNGDPTLSQFGGVQIANAGIVTQELAHNTIVFNAAVSNAPSSAVDCGSVTFGASSNIIWANSTSGSTAPVVGQCTHVYSDLQDTDLTGDTGMNISLDPQFIDTIDFRLPVVGSPCVDSGDPALDSGVDIDGEPRKIGSAPDIGADEASDPT